MPESLPDIGTPLLQWFARYQRSLPWRQEYDPYRIWVVEIILQQTQVQHVIPYYERFMERFPDVQSLAAAPLDLVLRQWAGLGYYRRGRYLHQAAQQVMQEHDGKIPSDLPALMALPGVGRYTAGAVRSIGFNLDAPIVDGNVTRVLSRLFAIRESVKSTAAQRRFWELAEALIPSGNARAFNQALMELGSLVCTPTQPGCDDCPLCDACQGYATEDPCQFPQMPNRPQTVARRDVVALIAREGCLLLGQRRAEDRWGGLWEFPRATCQDGESDRETLDRLVRGSLGLEYQHPRHWHTLRHTVTRYRIRLAAYRCDWAGGTPRSDQYSSLAWVPLSELLGHAAPSSQTRLVRRLLQL